MRPIDKSWTSKAEKSQESAAVTLLDEVYETGKKIVTDTVESVKEHPYLTAGAVAAAVALPMLRAGRVAALTEEGAVLAERAAVLGRTESAIGVGMRFAEPGAAIARAGGTARRTAEMVDIPIVR